MLLESLHRREGILARVSSYIDFPEYPEDLENKVETLEDPDKTRVKKCPELSPRAVSLEYMCNSGYHLSWWETGLVRPPTTF